MLLNAKYVNYPGNRQIVYTVVIASSITIPASDMEASHATHAKYENYPVNE